MSEQGTSKVVSVVECAKCGRVLAPESGEDCPNHTLPCCGGNGTIHAAGCKSDPAFQAGMRAANDYNRAVAAMMFGGPLYLLAGLPKTPVSDTPHIVQG